eukprot:COSAG02_NODE_23698_length_710_cov_11.057283_1_plen_89_part_10
MSRVFDLSTIRSGCSVFGRDEGGSEFTFTQEHINTLVESWIGIMRGSGSAWIKPDATRMVALDLCISDVNKHLLLQNEQFIPFCVDALL